MKKTGGMVMGMWMAAVFASAVLGQSAAVPATAPEQAPAGPPAPVALSSDARDVLTMLQDRKKTLKDFTSAIAYSTTDKTGSVTTRTGTLDYINDPNVGPMFSAKFTLLGDGVHNRMYHLEFIFDGHVFTVKDFGANNNVKQFVHTTLVKPGDPPGSATTLGGPMPLPIGLNVDDVARDFDVTVEPGAGADQAVLKLIPREKGTFNYASLEVTVDKKNQLPVKLVQTAADGTDTTIELTNLKINPGNAKMLDASTPAGEGWTERK